MEWKYNICFICLVHILKAIQICHRINEGNLWVGNIKLDRKPYCQPHNHPCNVGKHIKRHDDLTQAGTVGMFK